MLTYSRLNLIVRVGLIGIGAALLLLLVAAAGPTPRFRGVIMGKIGTPQPMLDDYDNELATVTLEYPAVVSFPPEWGMPDQLCAVVTYRRGDFAAPLPFEDELPQTLWDAPDQHDLVIRDGDVSGRTPDDLNLILSDPALPGYVSERFPYNLLWFTRDPMYLPPNQALSRLLCYIFRDAASQQHIPALHVLRFRAENGPVVLRPGYFFRYEVAPAPADPPEAYTLTRINIADYLAQLDAAGSPVIAPKAP